VLAHAGTTETVDKAKMNTKKESALDEFHQDPLQDFYRSQISAKRLAGHKLHQCGGSRWWQPQDAVLKR